MSVTKKQTCPSCGTDNAPTSRFCSNCGSALTTPEPEAVDQTILSEPISASVAAEITKAFTKTNNWLIFFLVISFLAFEFGDRLPLPYEVRDFVLTNSPILLAVVGALLLVNTAWFVIRRHSFPAPQPKAAKATKPLGKVAPVETETKPKGSNPAAQWLLLAAVLVFLYLVVWPFFAAFIDADGDLDQFAENLQNSDNTFISWLWNFSDAIVSGTSAGGGGSGATCSFQWPSGGGTYTTDPGGNQMYVAGAGGEPSISDCYSAYGTNMCDDPNGNQVNMDALCSAYPCTPLCERLGLH